MYNLVIVDDEEAITEGLSSIVNWAALDFEVIRVFSDGREVLQYLEGGGDADIILTDIKMTFVSGLDIAQYVYNNLPEIKIVLMSGYQEFELAQQALAYNVRNYLIKPTSLKEINRVFTELRTILEKERWQSELFLRWQQKYHDLLYVYREQFFSDLVAGALRSKNALDRGLRELHLDPEQCRICLFSVNSEVDQPPHTINCVIDGLGELEGYELMAVGDRTGDSYIVCLSQEAGFSQEILEQKAETTLGRVSEQFQSVTGTNLFFTLIGSYSNFYEAVMPLNGQNSPKPQKCKDAVEPLIPAEASKRKMQLFVYINSLHKEMAASVFNSIMDQLSGSDIRSVRSQVIDLFSFIRYQLEQAHMDMPTYLFFYEGILPLETVEEVRIWGLDVLSGIMDHLEKVVPGTNDAVILKAKAYIEDNYDWNISLGDVASHVCLSAVYFSQLFKQKTGVNFIEYLTKIRMEKAKYLLANTDLKVYEVSQKTGYNSNKHFHKLFKQYTGVTPAQIKSLSQKNKEEV